MFHVTIHKQTIKVTKQGGGAIHLRAVDYSVIEGGLSAGLLSGSVGYFDLTDKAIKTFNWEVV